MNAYSNDSTADRRQRLRQRLQRALSLSSCDSDGSGSALSGDTIVDDPSFQGQEDERESHLGSDEGEQSPGNEHSAPTKGLARAFPSPQNVEAIDVTDSIIAMQCVADLDNRMNGLESALHEQNIWNESTNHLLEDLSKRLAAVETLFQDVRDTGRAGREATGGRRRSTRQSAQPRQ
ncbi:hypothetical protein N7478_010039 [Penicillium angulare]|uniref:uncharacterized protein n=1 Tax=Penicillium angulare TaxID=116970 RepID=UPI00253FFB4C|nr:uncharacterized protein N7478_010039 [Penicillium angulare]KAJ5267231.1 hypothetical protein N7478_010039 [Penicillium angulare]